MKNYVINICIILLSAGVGWYAGATTSNRCDNKKILYKEIGTIQDSTIRIEDFADEFVYSPLRLGYAIISNSSAAATITFDYISFIYGVDCAKEEQPYEIQLINDQIWCVRGHLAEKRTGGVFLMMIEKRTGKILSVKHEK